MAKCLSFQGAKNKKINKSKQPIHICWPVPFIFSFFTSVSDLDSYHFVMLVITLSYVGIRGKWNVVKIIQKILEAKQMGQSTSSVSVKFTKTL